MHAPDLGIHVAEVFGVLGDNFSAQGGGKGAGFVLGGENVAGKAAGPPGHGRGLEPVFAASGAGWGGLGGSRQHANGTRKGRFPRDLTQKRPVPAGMYQPTAPLNRRRCPQIRRGFPLRGKGSDPDDPRRIMMHFTPPQNASRIRFHSPAQSDNRCGLSVPPVSQRA